MRLNFSLDREEVKEAITDFVKKHHQINEAKVEVEFYYENHDGPDKLSSVSVTVTN